MAREKSPKPDTLTSAVEGLRAALKRCMDDVKELESSVYVKNAKKAQTDLTAVHAGALAFKDAVNFTYRHITELKPKAEPKAPKERAAKAAGPGDVEIVECDASKAERKAERKAARKLSKSERRSKAFDNAIHGKAEPKMTEADPDAP